MRTTNLLAIALMMACSGGSQLPESRRGKVKPKDDDSPRGSFARRQPIVHGEKVPPGSPLTAERRPVIDLYHGVRVEDAYRWMETPSAEFDQWLRAQNEYARRVLGNITVRDAIRGQLRKASREIERVEVLKVVGGRPRVLMLRRGAGDETAKLVVRDGWAGAERILVDPGARSVAGSHVTIDDAYPSTDGRYVAYVVSTSGSEDGTIEIVEVDSGRLLPDRIDRTQIPLIAWRPDGRSFFYWRRAKPRPGQKQTEKYRRSATYLHVLGESSNGARAVIGGGYRRLGLDRAEHTHVVVTPGSSWALAFAQTGVNDWAFFVSPLTAIKPGATPWRAVALVEERVIDMIVHGDRIYALTAFGAPNYRVVSFEARSGSVSHAEDFVATSDMVLVSVAGAADALYVVALDRGVHRLFRVPWKTGVREEVGLPFPGSVRSLVADPTREGLVFGAEGWTHGPAWYEFDPTRGLHELPLASSSVAIDGLVLEQATATSSDGTEVPLSILRHRDRPLEGNAPALLNGYGAYGLPTNPGFSPLTVAWVKRGGVYASCHVRGSGARGKSWHLAGIKANKEMESMIS